MLFYARVIKNIHSLVWKSSVEMYYNLLVMLHKEWLLYSYNFTQHWNPYYHGLNYHIIYFYIYIWSGLFFIFLYKIYLHKQHYVYLIKLSECCCSVILFPWLLIINKSIKLRFTSQLFISGYFMIKKAQFKFKCI